MDFQVQRKVVSDMSMDVKTLGQVFTPQGIVSDMIALRKNFGTVLEPSCGDGAFSNNIPNCVAIEIDKTKAPENALIMDFFDYPIENKFDTIIGNPPYVRFQDIGLETKRKLDMSLFDERSNLYLFFIHKCIEHLNDNGELIFIVPRDFLKATSAVKLNEYIFSKGTITDLIELGDTKVFEAACPNTVIFRFEKDNFTRKTNCIKTFDIVSGQIVFTSNLYPVNFSDLFFVKVGAVSGADKLFESPNGNKEFVCSKTAQHGTLKRMFYDTLAEELLPYKELLLQRKIRTFNDTNWFQWGRKYYESSEERIYVNQKTRNENPFFYNPCKAYDGSVLAIFPKFPLLTNQIIQLAKELNSVNWEELGFVCDGRFIFSQHSLENTVLPPLFQKYIQTNNNALLMN